MRRWRPVGAALLGIGVLGAGFWGYFKSSGPELKITPGGTVKLVLSSASGFKINDKAPSSVQLLDSGSGESKLRWELESLREVGGLEFKVPQVQAGTELALDGRLYVCRKSDASVCAQISRKARLRVDPEGTLGANLNWSLEPELGRPSRSE